MTDVRHYSVSETLRNGLKVTIRAIRPDDSDAFLAAFNGLNESTVYLRFFGPKHLSQEDLIKATNVDFVQTVALVVCVPDDGGEKIIGGGRYIAFGGADPPDKAEVAFVVEEDYQRLGIAGLMLRHLADIAKDKGITQFHAEVLPENKGMLAVFKRSGLPVRQESSEGVVHVTLSIAKGAS